MLFYNQIKTNDLSSKAHTVYILIDMNDNKKDLSAWTWNFGSQAQDNPSIFNILPYLVGILYSIVLKTETN